MAIVWFSDEDRQRMREDERMSRLYGEFLQDYMTRHYKEASREQQVTPGELRLFEQRLPLGGEDQPPRRWKHHPRFDV